MTSFGQGLSVVTLADRIMNGIVAHFAAAGHPLPPHRFLAPGTPRDIAWDCEQMVVALEGIGWGQALDMNQESQRPGSPFSVSALRHAVFEIQIVRCTPSPNDMGEPPSVAQLDAAGRQCMRDAGLLSQALVTMVAQLRQGMQPGELVQAGTIDTLGPDGGFHAVASTMYITAMDLS